MAGKFPAKSGYPFQGASSEIDAQHCFDFAADEQDLEGPFSL
jgi:hypothetical protein